MRAVAIVGWVQLGALIACGCSGGSSEGSADADAGSSRDSADVVESPVDAADGATLDAIGEPARTVDGAEDGSDASGSDIMGTDADAALADAGRADRLDAAPDSPLDAASQDAPAAETAPAGPPPDLHCTADTIDPLQGEAVLRLTSVSTGAVPLCSGWVLVATTAPAELSYRNVIDGRTAGRIPLPASPGRFVVDLQRDMAHVALPSRKSLARIDLKTGAVAEVNTTQAPASVALGNDGLVFVTEIPYSSEFGLAVIDTINSTLIYEDLKPYQDGFAFDRAGNQLFTREFGLVRYRFDPAARMLTQLEKSSGACGVGNGIVVSPDGKHLLSNCPPTPQAGGVGTGIYDVSPSSLTTNQGQFVGLGGVAAFSPDSSRIAVVSQGLLTAPPLRIADVAGHDVLSMTVSGFGCETPEIQNIAWSRGGKMVHMTARCSAAVDYSRLYAVQAK